MPALPALIGGSADLTGSNGTRTKHHTPVAPQDFSGNYIHYGVREHAMAAAMNGMALHGGIVPYGGTFLVFTDYCRPAIRLSALMGQRVIYVMTHDSIGLGEDGPTHQPVEHLAALRAIPNLNVFRPADADRDGRVLGAGAGGRQDALDPGADAAGGAGLAHATAPRRTGRPRAPTCWRRRKAAARDVTHRWQRARRSALAMEARERARQGWGAGGGRVDAVLGTLRRTTRCLSRAGAGYGAARCRRGGRRHRLGALAGRGRRFIGMEGFGASAPAAKLYEHFGITATHVAEAARQLIKRA